MILIADDDFDTQKILYDYLVHHGYEATIALNGHQALKMAEAFGPAVALVDVRMPGPSGIALATQLREKLPGIEVVIMTAYAKTEDAVDAISKGAFFYLAKPLQTAELLTVVQKAMSKAQSRPPVPKQLSKRRREVLHLLAESKSNREIGEELGLTEKTIANYIAAIFKILNVHNRGEAVNRARVMGIVRDKS